MIGPRRWWRTTRLPSRAEGLPVSPPRSAARHGRSTILLDPVGLGGAILNTERVEDFPGFPEGVPGFELGPQIQEQVADAGAVVEMEEVRRIEPRGDDWAVVTDSRELVAGAGARRHGNEAVRSACAPRGRVRGQGAQPLRQLRRPLVPRQSCRDRWRGDSALLEALELTHHDVQVVLIDADEALSGQEAYGRRVRGGVRRSRPGTTRSSRKPSATDGWMGGDCAI